MHSNQYNRSMKSGRGQAPFSLGLQIVSFIRHEDGFIITQRDDGGAEKRTETFVPSKVSLALT